MTHAETVAMRADLQRSLAEIPDLPDDALIVKAREARQRFREAVTARDDAQAFAEGFPCKRSHDWLRVAEDAFDGAKAMLGEWVV